MKQITITKITDHNGKDLTSGHYPDRVGRKGSFYTKPEVGRSVMFDYPVPGHNFMGLLRTAKVEDIEESGGGLKVTTEEGIYYFAEVG